LWCTARFLLYINDLPLCSSFTSLLFADDTTLLLSDDNLNALVERVNLELQKVQHFFRFHKMALHVTKTKFMLITNNRIDNNRALNINLNSNNANENHPNLISPLNSIKSSDEVPAIRFLGVYFDPKLNFDYHVKLIISKLSKALYVMRTVKNLLSTTALKALYYSLFHCHLIFCLPIWSTTSKKNLSTLFKLQKSAVRIVNHSRYNEHSEPIFNSLKILPLESITLYSNLQIMFRFKNNLLPQSFSDVWSTNAIRRAEDFEIVLRNQHNFNIPFARTQFSANSPIVKLPQIWENFDDMEIKMIVRKSTFSLKLKNFLLSKLSSVPVCTRLLCPTCHLRL